MNTFSDWVESRNKGWSNPSGFLAVTSINWLSETPQTFKDVTGIWKAIGHEVYASGFEGREESHFSVPMNGELMEPMAGGMLEIASRGGQVILRPRRTDSPALAAFKGVHVFDYDESYRVEATLIPHAETVKVMSVVGDLGNAYDSPGSLEFVLHGQTLRLIAFTRPDPDALWVIFRDASNGKSTYGTGRAVTAKRIDGDLWEIDFNLSSNFPCSYTDFATCPLAPRENHLEIEINAGEKKPEFRHTAEGVVAQ